MEDKNLKVIYLTSFSYDLYKLTGYEMVKSYLAMGMEDPMIVTFEGFPFHETVEGKDSRIIPYDLSKSKFMEKWLINNRDIIPDYLGGLATQISNPKLFKNNWNRKASRWFRKIASFEYAIRKYEEEYDYIIWIDCDSLITKKITHQFLAEKVLYLDIHDYDIFYHLGNHRKNKNTGIESGVIGFKKGDGYKILKKIFDIYSSGDFRKLKRWDDGWLFRVVIESCREKNLIKAVDLVDGKHILSTDGKLLNVIDKGVFKDYILHKKGTHLRAKVSV